MVRYEQINLVEKLVHKGYDGADINALFDLLYEHRGLYLNVPYSHVLGMAVGVKWIPPKEWEFAHQYVDQLRGK